MNRIKFSSTLILCSLFLSLSAQDDELSKLVESQTDSSLDNQMTASFKTTRLINLTTIEQVKKGELDFRIAHRFGNLAGPGGGSTNFFGLENVSDIRFSFDYGLTDRLAIGIGRSKGAYDLNQLWDANSKYKILIQNKKTIPISLSVNAGLTYTTMPSASASSSVTHFDRSAAHRFNYFGQVLIARKMSNALSFILAPTIVHRNLVTLGDNNTHYAIGIGARAKISNRAAIIADYYQLINKSGFQSQNKHIPPIGLGFELETGGHVFHIILSNTGGLMENQFIPLGNEDPTKGNFRLGFNISRVFTILKDK